MRQAGHPLARKQVDLCVGAGRDIEVEGIPGEMKYSRAELCSAHMTIGLPAPSRFGR
jgi:hypothetical protein